MKLALGVDCMGSFSVSAIGYLARRSERMRPRLETRIQG
jgi:hypothetical protein